MHSEQVSVVYVFNLVVGAGALALPQAFAQTGWVLGIMAIIILGMMSFVTSTFMVEAMSVANAVEKQNKINRMLQSGESADLENSINKPVDERTALLQGDSGEGNGVSIVYEISEKKEMGEMAKIFFNNVGVKLFYVVIAIYLYGDLAIYAAAVPKSLTLVTCSHLDHMNSTGFDGDHPCFKHLSVGSVYRLYLLAFSLALGPFAFFDLGKTKYMQILTTVFRWIAFVLMISLASYGISKRTERIRPTMFDVSKLPNFFGVSVYSFMCQHSLPSILTPTEKKTRLTGILSLSFGMVTCFYLLLTITSVFCFKAEDIVDLYTLNFLSSEPFLAYFLALFPVFTLSTNFPIIAITLRENLKIIFSSQNTHCSPFAGRIIYPLITIVPPIAIAFGTQNVEMLVGVTGSYAGAVIQYVVPVMLVLCGRKKARQLSGSYVNKHRSMFRQKAWIYFVLAWTVACIGFVTANHIMSLVH